MKLSIIVLCFNEEKTIIEIIQRVKNSLNSLNISHEIIVIDDNSTDKTSDILKNDLNNIVDKLIQNADLEYDPKDYSKLLKPLQNDIADVVFGSRFVGTNEKRVLYFWHSVGNKLLTILSNIFSNLNLTDMEVGYKVFKSEILKLIELKENRFGFEPEITAKLAKLKVRIYEVGINYYGRKYEDGKKNYLERWV